ncbi:MAG: hypothetical protein A2277_13960 [Desulfobacterales bacterium RIFOXYA12_FULL_46_15]|nr:MAG: hypothetical protein A2097_15735 [Desulfobacula sp. GWF2_41_7]OGR23467.1 MAG: hypothetical protein A2277_13960 [Desulfobacterales bacterium RIFOXYA12_FULL_46_15]
MNFANNDKEGMFKNIFTAYAILLLHLIFLVGAGVAVVLFKGVYHYLPWIMACIGIIVLAGAFVFYQRLKSNSSDIGNFLSKPGLEDRTIEVKLIGGLASFRISPKENGQLRQDNKAALPPVHLLNETAVDMTEQKIMKLIALFEKNLITEEEFEKAKQKILQG